MEPKTLREFIIQLRATIGGAYNVPATNYTVLQLAEMLLKEIGE